MRILFGILLLLPFIGTAYAADVVSGFRWGGGACGKNTYHININGHGNKFCCNTSGCGAIARGWRGTLTTNPRLRDGDWAPMAHPNFIQCVTRSGCNQFKNERARPCPNNPLTWNRSTMVPVLDMDRRCWDHECREGFTQQGANCIPTVAPGPTATTLGGPGATTTPPPAAPSPLDCTRFQYWDAARSRCVQKPSVSMAQMQPCGNILNMAEFVNCITPNLSATAPPPAEGE